MGSDKCHWCTRPPVPMWIVGGLAREMCRHKKMTPHDQADQAHCMQETLADLHRSLVLKRCPACGQNTLKELS